jgi:hypothetical protein
MNSFDTGTDINTYIKNYTNAVYLDNNDLLSQNIKKHIITKSDFHILKKYSNLSNQNLKSKWYAIFYNLDIMYKLIDIVHGLPQFASTNIEHKVFGEYVTQLSIVSIASTCINKIIVCINQQFTTLEQQKKLDKMMALISKLIGKHFNLVEIDDIDQLLQEKLVGKQRTEYLNKLFSQKKTEIEDIAEELMNLLSD